MPNDVAAPARTPAPRTPVLDGRLVRYLLGCAWRASHRTVTDWPVTRCTRCERAWVR